MFMRQLGRSGVQVSALGLGCWAIGGPYWENGQPRGWGQIDDDEALRAIQRGLDLGVTFFDTADTYGAGHSERLLGRALAGKRDRVVIATKFGFMFDEATRQVIGRDASPAYIRRACAASLKRLNTDYIDLYQFHLGDYGLKEAGTVLTYWKNWSPRDRSVPMPGARMIPSGSVCLRKDRTAPPCKIT
jgi:aryl-alcohol dehydrogenase-like predicted oxidoreductase